MDGQEIAGGSGDREGFADGPVSPPIIRRPHRETDPDWDRIEK
jgi:hypothetical protein